MSEWRQIHFYVRDFAGQVAVGRRKGREVAAHIQRLTPQAAYMEIDFKGVEVASPPFMQEVTKAVRSLKDRAIYSNLTEECAVALDIADAQWREGHA